MIGRRALVARHAVETTEILPRSPLSVGNGEFCFTVDVTGLQTFPDRYPVESGTGAAPGTLLGTMAQWGWHSVPGSYDLAETFRSYGTPRGPVPYVDMSGELTGVGEASATPAERWLRANPHRLDLARIGLAEVMPDEVTGVHQRLDLWTGIITSRFLLRGVPVQVTTVCHPQRDVLAVRLESAPGVRIAFPYGSESWNNAADWTRPDAHTTTFSGDTVHRLLDGTSYTVRLGASPDTEIRQTGAHKLLIVSPGEILELTVEFTPRPTSVETLGFEETVTASREAWAAFWTSGGAVSLEGSRDSRAPELERRIVLSQYLTKINCAGSFPPAETGLTVNSWRGRFNLEMHWWHGAHFVLWGRPKLLERSLGWYSGILPVARETARRQGYRGARWPKLVAPDGREAPSPIGPFLIWQQPHPIYLAELLRRANPQVVHRYAELVLESAAFMADFALDGYHLGPPVIPAQESYASSRATIADPTFELAYWSWALGVAQRWRRLLGLTHEPLWDDVAENLARPLIRDGVYTAIGTEPYTILDDHPSMLYALGFVPPTRLINPDVMRETLHRVLSQWPWETTWGWDYPAIAMTATRLGEPETAVEALLMATSKNEYLPNGHNYQTPTLPLYLPGNGGLLAAVAPMTAGTAPGFPAANWTVHHEGLHSLP